MSAPEPQSPSQPPICNYEGSSYRTEFWERGGRDYEDRAERIALRRLLPTGGERLLEVGAGFGRLTDEYHMYRQVVLLDYAISNLQDAQARLGRSERYLYVAGDAYHLPFRDGVFDGATMIRVIHHMANVTAVLEQIRRVLAPDATFILEHANKRNLKAIARYLIGRQRWSPYDCAPVEFVELNFDFHPDYISTELSNTGFVIERRIPVSFFRLRALKQRVQPGILAGLDGLLQTSGLLYSPSIFIKATSRSRAHPSPNAVDTRTLFICPGCGSELEQRGRTLQCRKNGHRYAIRDGIYDFKAPLDDDERV
jgi:SAM-dependent methyltransferase/predicted RNA-binding Zn-ribbon protein involved in translation (DUF1610 family)